MKIEEANKAQSGRKSGWLKKKRNKGWKKRWFVLFETALRYYEKKDVITFFKKFTTITKKKKAYITKRSYFPFRMSNGSRSFRRIKFNEKRY